MEKKIEAVCAIAIWQPEKSLLGLLKYTHKKPPICYKIERDHSTGKFPELDITILCNRVVGRHFYGCIAVPEFEIDIAGIMSYHSDEDCLIWNYNFDVNEYNIKNVNEVTVRVYTQPDSFQGYCNAIFSDVSS